MRYIDIAKRFHPFSHQAGVAVPVPFTDQIATVFPALLHFGRDYPLNVKGPVKEFTVVLDLEKGRVVISGRGENGFFRYVLSSVGISVLKEPEGGLGVPSVDLPKAVPLLERLSLGSHKKQEKIDTLEELLPIWHALSQRFPEKSGSGGVLALLKSDLLTAYRAGFRGLFAPQLEDTLYMGLQLPKVESGSSPFSLISEGGRAIRALFLTENEGRLALHPPFHAGRLTGWEAFGIKVDMEWMGKKIQRLLLTSSQKRELQLLLPTEIKSFRVRESVKERGVRVERNALLQLGETPLYLDRFEK